jgi:hypothetical protein
LCGPTVVYSYSLTALVPGLFNVLFGVKEYVNSAALASALSDFGDLPAAVFQFCFQMESPFVLC